MSGRPLPTAAGPSASPLPARSVWLLALPLVAVQAGLLAIGDLAGRLPLTLTLCALGFAALWFAAGRLELARGPLPAGAVLAVAALLRLLLLPVEPTLSNDLYRYLWDGRVVAAGANPYSLPPAAPELMPLRDELYERLDHREVPTVYPPLALAVFTLAAAGPAPALTLKALLAAADLAGCALLLALARRFGKPAGRAVWYAWNPLVVLEVAGMGHVDALGVAAAVAAVWALTRERPAAAGLAAGAGVLAKLAPLAALPVWARDARHRGRFLATAGLTTALAAVGVVAASDGVPPGLVAYGVSWEFNGPVYEPLWRSLDALGADEAVARGLDRLKQWSHHHEALNPLYPYVYPQLLAKLILGLGMFIVVVVAWRTAGLLAATGRLFGGLLVLSATVYPWYLLWVLPWAALARHPAWLGLSASILLVYLPQHGTMPLMPWVLAAVWIPFLLLWLVDRRAWSTP